MNSCFYVLYDDIRPLLLQAIPNLVFDLEVTVRLRIFTLVHFLQVYMDIYYQDFHEFH